MSDCHHCHYPSLNEARDRYKLSSLSRALYKRVTNDSTQPRGSEFVGLNARKSAGILAEQ